MAIAFTWVIRLDKKKRLVLPMKARQRLDITDSVLIKCLDGRIIVKADGDNRLDKKFRLVIPREEREKLEIEDAVLLELKNDELVITRVNGETGRAISRNCFECGSDGVTGSIGDCGSPGLGSNPSLGPFEGDGKNER